jgi:flavin-dependent dehydrogenase
MNIPPTCDIVVIGGGPAGSLAATYLSQKGYAVVLLEKQQHPRYAVGESLLPDFWKYCDEAGVSAKIEAEGFIRKAGGSVDWEGAMHRLSFKDFGYTRPALHVERDRFDQILLTHARACGAQVFEQVAVIDADFSDPAAVVVNYRAVGESAAEARPERITCRYVVDASGQNAVIGRQLGLRIIDEAFRFMSVWGYFTDSSYLAADGQIYPASQVRTVPPTTYVSALPQGDGWAWLWHIMLRDLTSIGLVLPLAWVKSVKAQEGGWESWYLRQCEAIPLLQRLLQPARFCPGSVRLVRDYAYRSRQVAGPGFFLIGDAAGFIDPIFSVGVVLGMYGAYIAAWSIDRCLQTPARCAEYQAIFTRQLQNRLELGRALALPYYQTTTEGRQQARQAIAFAGVEAQGLMYAAALLTARSPNFTSLIDSPTIHQQAQARLHTLQTPL